jgi:hypothetical protein
MTDLIELHLFKVYWIVSFIITFIIVFYEILTNKMKPNFKKQNIK